MTPGALAEQNLGMVYAIAADLKRGLPPSVEVDDLIQEGSVGLLEAARRYDGRLEVTFQQFARRRVLGAMLDSVRRKHWRIITAQGLDDVIALADPSDVAGDVERTQRAAMVRATVRGLHSSQRGVAKHFMARRPGRTAEKTRRVMLTLRYKLWALRPGGVK